MMDYIITRHPGAIDWLRARGFEGIVRDTLTPEMASDLQVKDRVIGVLPMVLAFEVLKRKASVYLVQFPARNGPRGTEFSAAEMEEGGAKLFRFGLVQYCYCTPREGDWIPGLVATACPNCCDYGTTELELRDVA